jgi:hypothetical protein
MATRSLITGLLAGLFLAVLLQQLAPFAQLPIANIERATAWWPAEASEFTDMLKNFLPIARQTVRGGAAAGGYKSAIAATSSLLHTPTPASASHTSSYQSTTRAYSSTATIMSDKKTFLEAVQQRRTIYALNKKAPISDKQTQEIVNQAVLHVPSSFNSQSARLVVLLNEEHDKFWDFTLEILKTMVPEDQFSGTQQRITGFKNGYGTVSVPNLYVV